MQTYQGQTTILSEKQYPILQNQTDIVVQKINGIPINQFARGNGNSELCPQDFFYIPEPPKINYNK
jgi:hypothetical protein